MMTMMLVCAIATLWRGAWQSWKGSEGGARWVNAIVALRLERMREAILVPSHSLVLCSVVRQEFMGTPYRGRPETAAGLRKLLPMEDLTLL